MFKHASILLIALVSGIGLIGCATVPNTDSKKAVLAEESQLELQRIKREDPSLEEFLNKAHAYVIFPSVAKGGAGLGGAYGRGLLYQGGQMIGYADVRQATLGLQLGGQTYTEVIAFQTKEAMDTFKNNNLEFSANASAVAIESGAAATADYDHGVAVFTSPRGGLMFEASIGGQVFTYIPKEVDPGN